MKRPELSPRQRELLAFLYEYTLEHGYQPNMRDMIDHLGCSPSSMKWATQILEALERKGYIARSARTRSRAIVLCDWQERLRQHAQRVVEHDDVRDWAMG